MNEPYSPLDESLFIEIRELINSARSRISIQVNAGLVLMNWQIGKSIQEHILKGQRAAYGEEIIKVLSQQLTSEFGRGYSKSSLHHCLRVAETFPEKQIVSALSKQLSWTHFKSLIYIESPTKREFYLTLSLREGWSTRILRSKMDSMLFERTAISQKPEYLAKGILKLLSSPNYSNFYPNLEATLPFWQDKR